MLQFIRISDTFENLSFCRIFNFEENYPHFHIIHVSYTVNKLINPETCLPETDGVLQWNRNRYGKLSFVSTNFVMQTPISSLYRTFWRHLKTFETVSVHTDQCPAEFSSYGYKPKNQIAFEIKKARSANARPWIALASFFLRHFRERVRVSIVVITGHRAHCGHFR